MKLAVYSEQILIIASYSCFFKKYFSSTYMLGSILVIRDIELNKYVEICSEGTYIPLGVN